VAKQVGPAAMAVYVVADLEPHALVKSLQVADLFFKQALSSFVVRVLFL
jgi:hypothetical protein